MSAHEPTDLIEFAKTGAPPALSDHAWVDNSPTYSAVLADRDKIAKDCKEFCGDKCDCELPRWERPVDASCVTLPNGDCIAEVRCMHSPRASRPVSLNDFAAECHRDNQHWWHDPATGAKLDRNTGEMLMLVVSEIAECMEGERKDLMDDHLPHRKMAEVELADAIIRIADIAGANKYKLDEQLLTPRRVERNKGEALFLIVRNLDDLFASKLKSHSMTSFYAARFIQRVEDYAEEHGYDLWGAVAEKREYNKHRADHKSAARLAAHGKKF